MRRLLTLVLAGCSLAAGVACGSDSAVNASPANKGPRIVAHEAADWAPLASVATIRITNLSGSGAHVLKFFPQEKFVTVSLAIPCNEHGEDIEMAMIASPGADVSDTLACAGEGWYLFEGLFHFRRTIGYQTSSKLAGDTLTIDGKAREHRAFFNDGGRPVGTYDNDTELHGTIQVTGATCRVLAWAESSRGVFATGDRSDDQFGAGPQTVCTVAGAGL